MANSVVIGGQQMPGNALLPWSIASLARALLFYTQARPRPDRHASAAVASYYTLFHLGLFLIYACPKHQNAHLQEAIQNGLKGLSRPGNRTRKSWTNDPSENVKHGMVENFLRGCKQSGLPSSMADALVKARALREFINYGPRVDWNGKDISVDTCQHSTSELASLQRHMEQHFHESIGWACRQGGDDRIWVLNAVGAVEQYFTGPTRIYGDWCTDDEARVAESLLASLQDEARRAVIG